MNQEEARLSQNSVENQKEQPEIQKSQAVINNPFSPQKFKKPVLRSEKAAEIPVEVNNEEKEVTVENISPSIQPTIEEAEEIIETRSSVLKGINSKKTQNIEKQLENFEIDIYKGIKRIENSTDNKIV